MVFWFAWPQIRYDFFGQCHRYSAGLGESSTGGYDNVPCYQLSAGQQRRVALARLYISQAPLWVLDEPFTAIDKQGVAELEQRVIQHASEGGIVILTTHQSPQFSNLTILDLGDFVPSEVMERD